MAEVAEPAWALDREIVLCRVFDAPRDAVFRAWTGPDIAKWFGPSGFTCRTHERNPVVGGLWRFDLVAPNGKVWSNRVRYLEIVANERLVFEHGSDVDDDPGRFRVTLTFDSQSDGKTILTLRQLHPTKALRDEKIGFGAVELGYQTLDKLAGELARR